MSTLSPARAILLAVQFTAQSNLTSLRALSRQNQISIETLLRILLTHLPETLDPAEYVPFLEQILSEHDSTIATDATKLDASSLEDLSDEQAKQRVRKLGLLKLAPPDLPRDAPNDPVVLFLIHRSLRIDELTGLLTLIPPLFAPFLSREPYLRKWLITSILPLVRLNYDYYNGEDTSVSIPKFEALNAHEAVHLLLSNTSHGPGEHVVSNAGRDIRGLIGPWMYGKREAVGVVHTGWEETFAWIIEQATTSWETAVQAIEGWDGPGDVDMGGYDNGQGGLKEDDQQKLEICYARAILATVYLIPETSTTGLLGVGRILSRLVTLLDQERLPTLEQAAALLQPIPNSVNQLLKPENTASLRNDLMEEVNILTNPDDGSIQFAHALATSAFVLAKAGINVNLRTIGELVLLQNKAEQAAELAKLLARASSYQRQDEKFWLRIRNEIVWLRSWGAEELQKPEIPIAHGRGPFGQIEVKDMESLFLEAVLNNSQFRLARNVYESAGSQPLTAPALQETVIKSALRAYENATNANKTRGGVKKALDILDAFPQTLENYPQAKQFRNLIDVTHNIGTYKLVFKKGEPFKPIQLLVHPDPTAILGKILEQNSRSCTRINDFVDMANSLVRSGLVSTSRTSGYDVMRALDPAELETDVLDVRRRIVSMCIDAALSEDDFETAYSFVVTRLKDTAEESLKRRSSLPGLSGENSGTTILDDDWSWRAAFQAGQYRRTANTMKPSHLGNTTANPDIRHLEQRIDCVAQALRLAPKAALQPVLNIFRRCEEELESLLKQEAEEEAAWDAQGDVVMPGGFDVAPPKHNASSNVQLKSEEAPMSLFDLTTASMQRARNGVTSLTMARNSQTRQPDPAQPRRSADMSRTSTPDSTNAPIRKRDQLRNAGVGALTTGVGWILGAQPVGPSSDDGKK